METPPDKPSREERLAARLRDNLRRRKAQAREVAATGPAVPGQAPGDGTLPKSRPTG